MKKTLIAIGALVVLAISTSAAWGNHDSCRDNPSGQPANVGTNDSYVAVPVTGGYVGVDLHGIDGSADACFASPLDEANGTIQGERPELTQTPGARVGWTSCSHIYTEPVCFGTTYFGAEAGTVETLPLGTATASGTTVYGGMFQTLIFGKTGVDINTPYANWDGIWLRGPFLFVDGTPVGTDKTGVTIDEQPYRVGYPSWLSVGATLHGPVSPPFPVVVNKAGVETTPSENVFDPARVSGTAAYVDGDRIPLAEGETGVRFSPQATALTYDYELSPVGVAVCGPTVSVMRDGESEISEPLDVDAGSKSC